MTPDSRDPTALAPCPAACPAPCPAPATSPRAASRRAWADSRAAPRRITLAAASSRAAALRASETGPRRAALALRTWMSCSFSVNALTFASRGRTLPAPPSVPPRFAFLKDGPRASLGAWEGLRESPCDNEASRKVPLGGVLGEVLPRDIDDLPDGHVVWEARSGTAERAADD